MEQDVIYNSPCGINKEIYPVRRIKKGGLNIGKIRSAGEDKRVPQKNPARFRHSVLKMPHGEILWLDIVKEKHPACKNGIPKEKQKKDNKSNKANDFFRIFLYFNFPPGFKLEFFLLNAEFAEDAEKTYRLILILYA